MNSRSTLWKASTAYFASNRVFGVQNERIFLFVGVSFAWRKVNFSILDKKLSPTWVIFNQKETNLSIMGNENFAWRGGFTVQKIRIHQF
jgi:hypothetical protein